MIEKFLTIINTLIEMTENKIQDQQALETNKDDLQKCLIDFRAIKSLLTDEPSEDSSLISMSILSSLLSEENPTNNIFSETEKLIILFTCISIDIERKNNNNSIDTLATYLYSYAKNKDITHKQYKKNMKNIANYLDRNGYFDTKIARLEMALDEIETHLFNKYPCISDDDINIIFDALKELEVSDSLIDSFKNIFCNLRIKDDRKELISVIKKLANSEVTKEEKEQSGRHFEMIQKYTELLFYLTFNDLVNSKHTIYVDFKTFSSAIKNREKVSSNSLDLLFEVIRNNINNGLLDEETIFLDIDYSKTSYDDRNNNCNIIFKIFNFLILLYQEMDIEPNTGLIYPESITIEKLEVIIKAHKDINNHYLCKKDNNEELSDEDINIIANALRNLDIDERIIIRFIQSNKTKEPEITMEDSKKYSYQEEYEKNTLSIKEYNQIYNRLLKFFDFDKMEPCHYLCLDAIIYCIYQLKRLKLDNIINEFISKQIKFNNGNNLSPSFRYSNLVNKINYYLGNETIPDDDKEMIELLLEGITELPHDDNYEAELNKLLNEIITLIPSDYDYIYDITNTIPSHQEYLRLLTK